jgi:glucose/arabinose dehydrogenase
VRPQHLRVADEYAQIRRYDADGSNMEVIATGVRNTQGFDWHPVTKSWFTNHGRWMGDDSPEDGLNRLGKVGPNWFPYCHASVADGHQKTSRCEGATCRPGPTRCSDGHGLYTGNMFPAEY